MDEKIEIKVEEKTRRVYLFVAFIMGWVMLVLSFYNNFISGVLGSMGITCMIWCIFTDEYHFVEKKVYVDADVLRRALKHGKRISNGNKGGIPKSCGK